MLKSRSFQFRSLPNVITILLLVLWAAFVYRSSVNRFPSHVHAWTQSDRYALTIGYLDNGFGLFKPSTPNLWPKYPPSQMPEKLEGITKADLPVSEYLAAQMMRLTGVRQPLFHRGLNLILALLGILLLFSVMRRMGSSLPMAWLGSAFALFSPVFAYYLDGFIPGIPALGLLMAAYYFLYRYLESGRERFLHFSLGVATLAALIRPPMLMALPAIMLAPLLALRSRNVIRVVLPGVAGFAVFGVFQLYNRYLAANYGSLFISNLMPADSPAALISLIQLSVSNWKLEYFSYSQYLVLAFAGLLILLFRSQLRSAPTSGLLAAALIHLAAAAAYFVAMAKQFPDHDYYFLESFFLPIVLIVAIGLSLPKADNLLRKIVYSVVFVISTWLMADAALTSREKRYTTQPWDMTEKTRLLFEDSPSWLDGVGIARDARVLVLDSYTTNVPLLLMQRQGFTVINTTTENLKSSLSLPFDYLVIPNRSLPSDVLRNLPELASWLMPIANNGRIGLYRIDFNGTVKQLSQLILPDKKESVRLTDSILTIQSMDEFIELSISQYASAETARALVFDGFALAGPETVKDMHLVVDVSSGQGNLFYDSFRLDPFFEQSTKACHVSAFINLPFQVNPDTRLKCYLWNAGRNQMKIINPRVEILHYYNLKTS